MLHENRNEEFKFTVIENHASTLHYFENIFTKILLCFFGIMHAMIVKKFENGYIGHQ